MSSTTMASSIMQSEYARRFMEWSQWALEQGDPRVRDWPLMNPLHCLALIAVYLIVVPLLCLYSSRLTKGLSMKTFMLMHNTSLTALSLYMFVEILRQAYLGGYTLFCNPLDRTEKGLGMARIIWIYYLSKILEFGDTVIMALKKNYHQITFLHLYHHASIFFVWWIVTYYAPGGESYFSAALNSFIHVIMYGYYLWSSQAGPPKDPQRPRWNEPARYRKYITSMQLAQFCIMMVQAIYDSLVPTPGYPTFCANLLFFYMITMLALFGNFFTKSYAKDTKGKGNRSVKSE